METSRNAKLIEAQAELDDLYQMSEEAACFRYNTDTKQEAITVVLEWIEDLIEQTEEDEDSATDDDEWDRHIRACGIEYIYTANDYNFHKH